MAQSSQNQPTAQARLLGFLRYRLETAQRPWIRVDLDAFASLTGLTKRTAERALARLRGDGCALAFRTVWRHKAGRKGHWIVICAELTSLQWDCEPLFRSAEGKPRHVRPSLRCQPNRCNRHPSIGGFFLRKNSAVGRLRRPRPPSAEGRGRLERKAAAIADRLARTHWDNCKVRWERGPAFRWILDALIDGQPEKRIAAAYDIALHRLHGTATDRGEFFGLASTLHRAQRWMDAQPKCHNFSPNPYCDHASDAADIHRFEPIKWTERDRLNAFN